MRHGSLYSGIGGFELAANWLGWENVFNVEIDQWCNQVLKKKFNAKRYGDAKQFDGTLYRGSIDVLSGGPPCQEFSYAGNGGMDMELWQEFIRIAEEIDPTFIVAENVPGFAYRKSGLAFEQVCSELESKGYEIIPTVIPAASKGGFTRRDRVWITGIKRDSFDPNTNRVRLHRAKVNEQRGFEFQHEQISLPGSLVSESIRQGTDSRVFRDTDGLSGRVDRTRAIGNSIVPQVAKEIFKTIEALTN